MPSLPKPRLRRQRGVDLACAEPEPLERQPQVEIVQGAGLRWVNIERPTPLETAWLEEQFDFHALDFEDVLSRNQRPKIDEYHDYLFIVLHFPVFDRNVGRLNAGELDIFVGRDFLVTIPNTPLQPVEYLFERCRQKEELREQLFSKGSGLPAVPDHRRRLRLLLPDAAQDRQQARRARGRDLRGPLRGHRPRHLERQAGDHQLPQGDPPAADGAARPREAQAALPGARGGGELEIYFDDIGDAHERIWDMLENYKEVVEALEETNESYISHRVNDILRVLTAISVIVLPLTLIASIWGMNVGVPGEGGDTAFYVIVGSMVVLLVGMVAYFRAAAGS